MKIKLTAPIWHDGEKQGAGSVLDVNDKTGKRLIGYGVAELIESTPTATSVVQDGKQNDGEDTADKEEDEAGNPFGGEDAKPIEQMTNDELQAELSALGVPFDANMSREKLKNLLLEARG